MKEISLKNETDVILREATVQDAEEMVEFYNRVGGETDFLSFGGNEYPLDVKGQASAIKSSAADEASMTLLAVVKDKIIGIATISSGSKRRLRHVGVLGIVIELEYCNKGLGRIMIEELISWAKGNGVTKKINLVTREDNSNGIKLYESLGFKTEGVIRMDNFEKGRYYDSLAMGLILD